MFDIFIFVKQIKYKKLSHFLWQYFQGALPIWRNKTYLHDEAKLNHDHIFGSCDNFAESLLEGLVISNYFGVPRPPSNQTEFWQLFQLPSKGNYIRKCLAALTFQNAFLNHNKNLRSQTQPTRQPRTRLNQKKLSHPNRIQQRTSHKKFAFNLASF